MNKNTSIFVVAAVAWACYIIPISTTRADNTLGVPIPFKNADEVIYMHITAYSSSPDETDDTPFSTAMGTRVHDGVVATNILPFGSKIKIPALFGDKIFTVGDRMNRRIKNTVDIWMKSKTKALDFGTSYADIVVISKGD